MWRRSPRTWQMRAPAVLHPANATHRQMTDAELEAAGIAPETARLSCGIEDTQDLIDDVAQALDAI